MANEDRDFEEFAKGIQIGGGGAMPPSARPAAGPSAAPAADDYESFSKGIQTQQQQQAAQAPAVGTGEDIARSAAAGLGRGAAGLVGMPGDIRNLVEFALQKTGAGSLGKRYLPTSEEMIQKAEALHPSIKETLTYKPVTGFGEYAKSGAEFVPGALIGPGSLGVKVAGGLGAGLATQGAEDLAKKAELGEPAELALKIGASIPSYMLGAKAAGVAATPFVGAKEMIAPGGAAKKELAQALAQDVASTGKYGAPAGAMEALTSGAEIAPAAIAGTRTRKLLERSAASLPAEATDAYHQMAATAHKNAPSNTVRHIDDMFGREVNVFDDMEALNRRMRDVNSPNYERVMGMPELQSIGGPEYNKIIGRVPKSIMNKVFEDMQIGGIAPESIGLLKTKGGYEINPQGMPLRFWDELKKGLDSQITGLKDVSGKVTDPSRYNALNNLNSSLKTQLNKIDPYKAIRDEAAEMFGARDWTDLGQKYLNMSDRNINKVRDLELRLSNADADRQMDFAYGLAGAYKEMLANRPDDALALFKGKNGEFNARKFVNALAPLGPDAGYNLIGKANAEYLNRNIAAIKPSMGTQIRSNLFPYIGGAAGGLAELVLQPFLWSGNASAIMTALAGMGLGKLYSIKEARKGAKVLEMASDPAMSAELGRMIAADPAARSFLMKTNDVLRSGVKYPAGASASMNDPNQPQSQDQNQPAQMSKNAGGRVGRASGGRIDGMKTAEMLMRAAHNAKNKISKVSEQILDQPDESVVKALSIAKQHI